MTSRTSGLYGLIGLIGAAGYLYGCVLFDLALRGPAGRFDAVTGDAIPPDLGLPAAGTALVLGAALLMISLRRLRPGLIGGLFIAVHGLLTLLLGAYALYVGFFIARDLYHGLASDPGMLERKGPPLAAGVLVPGAYVALPHLVGVRWCGPKEVVTSLSGAGASVLSALLWIVPPGLAGVLGVLSYWYGIILMLNGAEAEALREISFGALSPRHHLLAMMVTFIGGAGLFAYGASADDDGLFSGLFIALHTLTCAVFLVWLVIAGLSYGLPFLIGVAGGGLGVIFSEVGGVMFFMLGVPGAYLILTRALFE